MKAVCIGDRWRKAGGRTVYYIADVLPSGTALMRPERLRKGGVYVAHDKLEHEDGWTWMPRKDAR